MPRKMNPQGESRLRRLRRLDQHAIRSQEEERSGSIWRLLPAECPILVVEFEERRLPAVGFAPRFM
eukprot:7382790-Prymnesium_polylepis.1